MTFRDWLGSLALLEVILICVAIKTGWRWHRAEPARRFLRALREQWKRVLLGAVAGWVLSSVLGLLAIFALYESMGIYATESLTESIAMGFPLAGVGLGALLAYSTRKEPAAE